MRNLFGTAALVAATLAAGACDVYEYDREVDWAPVELCIEVQDSEGKDLLDPGNPDNVLEGTTISFKGEVYKVAIAGSEEIESRAYLALIYGLKLERKSERSSGYCLRFGEIDGAADMDEDLTLTWPDGSKDVIHYHCSDHNERKLKCNRWWTLNGKDASNPFLFTKNF